MSHPTVTPATALTQVAGAGAAATLKLIAFDVPPSGSGFERLTCSLPSVAKSLAGTVAISSVAVEHPVAIGLASTHVVASAVPFHSIVTPSVKFEPYAMSVSAVDPISAVDGEIAVSRGALAGGVTMPPPPVALPPAQPAISTQESPSARTHAPVGGAHELSSGHSNLPWMKNCSKVYMHAADHRLRRIDMTLAAVGVGSGLRSRS
jgi:hypothetical protein